MYLSVTKEKCNKLSHISPPLRASALVNYPSVFAGPPRRHYLGVQAVRTQV